MDVSPKRLAGSPGSILGLELCPSSMCCRKLGRTDVVVGFRHSRRLIAGITRWTSSEQGKIYHQCCYYRYRTGQRGNAYFLAHTCYDILHGYLSIRIPSTFIPREY